MINFFESSLLGIFVFAKKQVQPFSKILNILISHFFKFQDLIFFLAFVEKLFFTNNLVICFFGGVLSPVEKNEKQLLALLGVVERFKAEIGEVIFQGEFVGHRYYYSKKFLAMGI